MRTDNESLLREKTLKNTTYDNMSDSDIKFLENQWIINGIWPQSYWTIIRWFMTRLFSMVCYKRHDVGFWQQSGFHRANWGLLKYSFLSLANDLKIIMKNRWYKLIYKIPFYIATLPLKAIVIAFAYIAVESKAWQKAYNASN